MKLEEIFQNIQKLPLPLMLLYLGYLGYGYYLFEYKEKSPVKQKRAQLSKLKGEITKLDAQAKELQKTSGELEQKRTGLKSLANELNEVKNHFSDGADIPEFINLITTEAKKLNFSITRIRPGGTLQKEYYSEVTFTLDYHGAYVQLMTFLDRISSLNKVVQIQNFSVDSAMNMGKYVVLDGQLELKIFKYRGTKADELNKG